MYQHIAVVDERRCSLRCAVLTVSISVTTSSIVSSSRSLAAETESTVGRLSVSAQHYGDVGSGASSGSEGGVALRSTTRQKSSTVWHSRSVSSRSALAAFTAAIEELCVSISSICRTVSFIMRACAAATLWSYRRTNRNYGSN